MSKSFQVQGFIVPLIGLVPLYLKACHWVGLSSCVALRQSLTLFSWAYLRRQPFATAPKEVMKERYLIHLSPSIKRDIQVLCPYKKTTPNWSGLSFYYRRTRASPSGTPLRGLTSFLTLHYNNIKGDIQVTLVALLKHFLLFKFVPLSLGQ